MKISIVIPVHNAGKTIAQTIESCLNQNYPREDWEIIAVDDGSTDNTAEILKKYPVKYIFQENSGPAKARNNGWQNAQGEIIFFTDSDCVVPRDWVSSLLLEYNSEEISGAGGSYKILNPDNLLAACIQEEIITRHLRMRRETNYLGSFNLSLRKNILSKIGGFDQSFRMATSEDRELSYRIIKSGGKLVFNREIRVAHFHPTNLLKYLRQQFWRIYWDMRVYINYLGMPVKDQYIFITEYFQPVLFLGIIFLSIITPFFLSLVKFVLGLVLIGLLLQLPLVFSIVKRTKKTKYLALIPVNFLRGFCWATGSFSGLLVFLFKRNKQS